MKSIRIFGRSIRDAFKSFIRNFGLSMASILCTTITLILVAVAIISAANIDNSTKLIESELSIVAYFKNDTTKENIENVQTEIKTFDTVSEVKFKSKDEWKLEMMAYDKTMETVLNYLPENPSL
jgi:Cell division protein